MRTTIVIALVWVIVTFSLWYWFTGFKDDEQDAAFGSIVATITGLIVAIGFFTKRKS